MGERSPTLPTKPRISSNTPSPLQRSRAAKVKKAKRLTAVPLVGSDAERKRILELSKLIGSKIEVDQLANVYSHAMSQHEFYQCQHQTLKPDGRPYPWQVEFHNASAHARERGIIAGNQTGKTATCAWDVAIQATGRYPKWWKGKRHTNPVKICVGSETNETLRDPQQLALFGPFKPETKVPSGKGTVPGECIRQVTYRQCGLVGVYDEVLIDHVSGGTSVVKSKTYEQGWTKWQGTQFDYYWLDEEPDDERIYSEVLRGCLHLQGSILLSRTPLFGMTWVIQHFMEGGKKIFMKNVTWEDAPHLDREAREELLKSIPKHEQECRKLGTPMMGEGAVYPVTDESVMCDPFPVPRYFKRIVGIDFGWDHPTGLCWIAYDADSDIIYVTDVYRQREQPPAIHAVAIGERGGWIPVAWPHDGLNKEKSGGTNLMEQYKSLHVNVLSISARYVDDKAGGQPIEPITQDILQRMLTGRLKVFSHLSLWFEEKRMYHRKDNKIVDAREDILSAMRYAVMMLRFAQPFDSPIMQTQADTSDPMRGY